MIQIMNQTLGDVSEGISYFNKITFNGAIVNEIQVSGDTIALGGAIPEIISELKDKGCNAIIDVFNEYPIIENVINGEHSLLMDGASYFDTLYVPSSADTVVAKFQLIEPQKTFQTLFCSRANSKNYFTTFITSTGVSLRPDWGDAYGAVSFNLGIDIMYTYTMKAGLAALDDGQSKTISSSEMSPTVPFVIGGSYEAYIKTDAYRNFMNQTLYNTFSVLGENNKYNLYLIPVSNNLMVDLVSGRKFNNGGSGNAIFQ